MSVERCRVFMFSGYCWRDVVRDGRCIFHLKSKSESEADRFEGEFFAELERLKKGPSPYIDLSRFVFPRSMIITNQVFPRVVLFNEAVFEGDVRFTGCTFIGEASFRKATFKGTARFDSIFTRRVDFFEAAFEKGSDFQGGFRQS